MSTPSANLPEVHDDLTCPLCGYSLRGLEEPRCPECGYRFTWQELLDTRSREHRFAFDAARRSSLRNICRTWLASFLPGQLWGTLKPSHQIRPRRLVLYILLMWLPLLGIFVMAGVEDLRAIRGAYERDAAFLAEAKAATVAEIRADPAKLREMQRSYGGSGDSAEGYAENRWGHPSVWRHVWDPLNRSWYALLPGLTLFLFFPSLMIFQWSMKSRQIDWRHVFRCFAYASSVVPLVVLALLGLRVLQYFKEQFLLPDWVFDVAGDWPLRLADLAGATSTLHMAMAAIAILMGWPLWLAYRKYFRFDHALLTVIGVQAIVLLCWAIIEVQLFGEVLVRGL